MNKKIPLSEIIDINMGQSPPSSTYNFDGDGLPFFQGKADFGERYPTIRVFCNKPGKVAEAGDILISVRAPVGPTNINLSRSCIGRGLAALHCKKDIDRNFLWYFLKYYESTLASGGRGSTFDAINREDLESIEIPLPSIHEQKRIVAILDQADCLHRLRRYAVQQTETFLQSVFIEMFGDPFKNSYNWPLETLEEYIEFLTSGSRGWAQHYSEQGDLFLRIQNIGKNKLLLHDTAFVIVPDSAEARRTTVQPRDLILSITADLGRTGIIPDNFTKAYINQHLALIRLKDLNPYYVASFMVSDYGRQQFEALNREGVKSGLNFDNVREFKILIPPKSLQNGFERLLGKFRRLQKQASEAERQAELSFQTLLQRAFTGQLTQEALVV